MEHRQAWLAGLTVALVGFASSFAVVLAGLRAVGATPAQAASGLVVLCVTQALGMLYLAHRCRMPVTLAWSTPGAALLASSGQVAGGWPVAVGAFLVVGVLVLVTAAWPLLGDLVAAIPRPIAQAMLAGVLFSLCLAPVHALADDPAWIGPLVVTWLVLLRLSPAWSAPAVFALALVLVGTDVDWRTVSATDLVPRLDLVAPELSTAGLLGLALPLYLVTMASQNVPGAAVIGSFGYAVPWRRALGVTGLGTVAGAAAGGHGINLAAITAALAASPDAHRDPAQRWRATAAAGWAYLVLAALTATLVLLISAARPGILEAVAGLALLGTLGSALAGATEDAQARIPAALTFLVAASGTTLLGVGAAFWALVGGVVAWGVLGGRQSREPEGVSTVPLTSAGTGAA